MLHTRAASNAHSRHFLAQMFRNGVDIDDAKILHSSLSKGKVDDQTRSRLRKAIKSVQKDSYRS